MRKGNWLNRPVNINHNPATNEYDVKIAIAKSVPEIIFQLNQSSICSSYQDNRIHQALALLKVKANDT